MSTEVCRDYCKLRDLKQYRITYVYWGLQGLLPVEGLKTFPSIWETWSILALRSEFPWFSALRSIRFETFWLSDLSSEVFSSPINQIWSFLAVRSEISEDFVFKISQIWGILGPRSDISEDVGFQISQVWSIYLRSGAQNASEILDLKTKMT